MNITTNQILNIKSFLNETLNNVKYTTVIDKVDTGGQEDDYSCLIIDFDSRDVPSGSYLIPLVDYLDEQGFIWDSEFDEEDGAIFFFIHKYEYEKEIYEKFGWVNENN